MALSGWKLTAIHLPGMHVFEQIPPSNIIYRLDYHNRRKSKMEAYLDTLFTDGWEFITKMNGWLYFSKEIPEEQHISSEEWLPAKIDKFTNQTNRMGSFLLVMLAWYPLFGIQTDSPNREILLAVYIVSVVLYVFILVKSYQRLVQLQKSS
jgi:hypothetical protein